MKTTSIKGVLSFCVAVTVTVAMAYSAVTVIQKNNVATEKAVKESQAIGSEVSTDSLKDGEYEGTATGYGGPLTVRITIRVPKSGWNQDLRDRKEWRNLKPESWSR